MRYTNTFLASPWFQMMALKKDMPNLVEPGHEAAT
jgi:hypothetical protein